MKIVSGIQPSGELHIGNYLGAIKNWINLQSKKNAERLFFIADYHSFTSNSISGSEKRRQIEDLVISLLALGLDPKKSILFFQSDIKEIFELAWIFNCLTPMGELERMTQYKDKAVRQKENINSGLFSYPVLMAADILIYKADRVPVGEDQIQHLELARETARRFNSRFGKIFIDPQPLLTETPRLMSLKNPLEKMSKSHPGSTIGIFEEKEKLYQAIKTAVTASNEIFRKIYLKNNKELVLEFSDPERFSGNVEAETMKAGVENILILLREFNPVKFKSLFINGEADLSNLRYGELKNDLFVSMNEKLSIFKEKKKKLFRDKKEILAIFKRGGKKAREIAAKNMTPIRKKIGLVA